MSAIVPPRSVATSTTSASTKFSRRPRACRRAGRDQKEVKTIPDTAKQAYPRDAALRVKKETCEKEDGAKLAPGMMTFKQSGLGLGLRSHQGLISRSVGRLRTAL